MKDPASSNELLVAKKRELLRKRLEMTGLARGGATRILRRELSDQLPLSYAQQRMLFLQKLDPTGPAYNVIGALVVEGALDVGALAESFQTIMARHDILRTLYRIDANGASAQSIVPDACPMMSVQDVRHLPDSERQRLIDEEIEQAGRLPFDLSRDLPLRVRLLRVDQDRHILVLVLHHIACDDLTWPVLLGELSTVYPALGNGQVPRLPLLPIQYSDFSAWQRQRVASGALDRERAYWRERLSPAPQPLDLHTDFPRSESPTSAGGRRSRTLPPELLERLQAIARDETAMTPFMVLLAAFQALLHRHTGKTDIAVGTPTVNRHQAEVEPLIGNFGNTLVLRSDLGGDPTFRELARRVRSVCMDAYAHQELPFECLVEDLQPSRSLSRSPFFDAIFSLRGDPLGRMRLPGLSLSERPAFNRAARFDLALEATVTAAGLGLSLTYRTELFLPETIDRLLDHMETLLGAAAAEPDRRVSELALITPTEKDVLVHGWNQTSTDEDLEVCLGRRFEAQVARTPERVAVVFEQLRLTYREINERANRLARRLLSGGLKPGGRVGVQLQRSADLVVGLLAVIKAGGAFVPLDPSLPDQRIALMCRDADLVAILSDGEDAARMLNGVPCVSPGDPSLVGYSADDLPDAPHKLDVVYVLYTSGSTGIPKGVMVCHQGLCNRLVWQASHLGLTADDVVLHKTPLSFDVAVGEIFLPLLIGATLVVARPDAHRDPNELLHLIAREKCTFAHFVASMLDVFLEQDGVEKLGSSLRNVWCGGEALSHNLYARFRRRLDARLFHGYGPTEASIGVTCRTYCNELGRHERISIGRPIANTSIHLLDGHLQPVPIGVVGELYIGGVAPALGYVNDPKLTAERWIPDPFGVKSSRRLYRTGDLARFLPDGNIEFVGRADQQVKLRGLRIELGEIEAVLAEHPAVRQAIVTVRGDRPGAEQLAAYYVGDEAGLPVAADDLRGWLLARLPEYMVPRAYMRVPHWPQTASGKIDRKALQAIELLEPAAPPRYIEPRDRAERLVAEVWAEALGLERVGATDNFFDLGGHSLLSVKVHARLQKELQREISLVDLFAYPTVAALAAHLGASPAESAELEQARTRATRQQRALTLRAQLVRRSKKS